MMPARKTETLTIRLCPETKAALRQAAEQEHRSLSNRLEAMIRDWSHRHLNDQVANPQPADPT
jgi:hypothetical protein